MIRLKICGLRDNIEEVARLNPDYVGFIFYRKSSRYIGKEFEMPEINKNTRKVGVFVNEEVKEVQRWANKYQLAFVQLHGFESPEVCKEIRESGIGVIKAFQMDESFDFQLLEEYKDVTDFFLFDTKTKSFGGSGESFDWELLKEYSLEKEYFLSGGLSLENINEVMKRDLKRVHAIDVNSRFEIRPGLKDINLLNVLMEKME